MGAREPFLTQKTSSDLFRVAFVTVEDVTAGDPPILIKLEPSGIAHTTNSCIRRALAFLVYVVALEPMADKGLRKILMIKGLSSYFLYYDETNGFISGQLAAPPPCAPAKETVEGAPATMEAYARHCVGPGAARRGAAVPPGSPHAPVTVQDPHLIALPKGCYIR